MQITFVRHGQSAANLSGRWQGHGDSPLTPVGRSQAAALAERLRPERYDLVVSSDLSRAADTAAALGRDLELDPAWREVDVGAWEGLTRPEVALRFADQIHRLGQGEPVRIGGGESWPEVLERARLALHRLRSRLGDGDRALVVTHGGVIHVLLSALMGLYERRPRPIGRVGNTATTTVAFEDGVSELVAFNDASHLGPVGSWATERLGAGDTVVVLAGTDEAAQRLGAPVVDRVDSRLEAAIAQLGPRHGGRRITLLSDPAEVALYAGGLFGHGDGATARVGAPRTGAICHLVWSRYGATFADYNIFSGSPAE